MQAAIGRASAECDLGEVEVEGPQLAPQEAGHVVDLGLVYDMTVTDEAVAKLDMTLTSAACPLTDVIEDQARTALVGSGLCTDLEINWVWLPPWTLDNITEEGREQLRAIGYNV